MASFFDAKDDMPMGECDNRLVCKGVRADEARSYENRDGHFPMGLEVRGRNSE